MEKNWVLAIIISVVVAFVVVELLGGASSLEELEPLAKVETELKNFEGGPGQRLLEIRTLVDNVLEPESDMYISWESGPE